MTVRTLEPSAYRGRFAPTPSGPLHLGSLLTALASFLDARAHAGQWLLRIDDLDAPRCVPGADARILSQLEAHGLCWDETPRHQSMHGGAYRHALSTLRESGALYACRCTRAALASSQREGPDGPVYPGTCRTAALPEADHALRVRFAAGAELRFADAVQGCIVRRADTDVGDVVVQRRDGIVGYHLACVVDDAEQRISDIVRGADLLGATCAQMLLGGILKLPALRYAHIPVLLGGDGLKLSKQNRAVPIDARHAADNLWECLSLLLQQPPQELRGAPPDELLGWAVAHWRISAIPAVRALKVVAAV